MSDRLNRHARPPAADAPLELLDDPPDLPRRIRAAEIVLDHMKYRRQVYPVDAVGFMTPMLTPAELATELAALETLRLYILGDIDAEQYDWRSRPPPGRDRKGAGQGREASRAHAPGHDPQPPEDC